MRLQQGAYRYSAGPVGLMRRSGWGWGAGKGMTDSQRGAQVRNEAGMCSGSRRSQHQNVCPHLTGPGGSLRRDAWQGVGAFGTYSPTEDTWPLKPHQSPFTDKCGKPEFMLAEPGALAPAGAPVSPLLTRSRSQQDHGSIKGAGAPVNPPIARRVGCSELYG